MYRTEEEKFRNAAKEIKELHEKGQPVLVGTVSVEKSEKLSGILKKMGVRHEVLNAKNHEREAFIVAQAGRKGAVTVSTNMAGRGTDILLGGNPDFTARERLRKENKDPDHDLPRTEWEAMLKSVKEQTEKEHDEVVALGGLHIVGTERHESRRIDNQLRGRAGRQGDPGSARFYLSLQDDLMRIFGGAAHAEPDAAAGHGRRRADREQADHQAHRGRAEGRRSAEFRLPQTHPRIRRRDEQAAPGGLRHAPRAARRAKIRRSA